MGNSKTGIAKPENAKIWNTNEWESKKTTTGVGTDKYIKIVIGSATSGKTKSNCLFFSMM